jgi:hypothetical protein
MLVKVFNVFVVISCLVGICLLMYHAGRNDVVYERISDTPKAESKVFYRNGEIFTISPNGTFDWIYYLSSNNDNVTMSESKHNTEAIVILKAQGYYPQESK